MTAEIPEKDHAYEHAVRMLEDEEGDLETLAAPPPAENEKPAGAYGDIVAGLLPLPSPPPPIFADTPAPAADEDAPAPEPPPSSTRVLLDNYHRTKFIKGLLPGSGFARPPVIQLKPDEQEAHLAVSGVETINAQATPVAVQPALPVPPEPPRPSARPVVVARPTPGPAAEPPAPVVEVSPAKSPSKSLPPQSLSGPALPGGAAKAPLVYGHHTPHDAEIMADINPIDAGHPASTKRDPVITSNPLSPGSPEFLEVAIATLADAIAKQTAAVVLEQVAPAVVKIFTSAVADMQAQFGARLEALEKVQKTRSSRK